MIFLVFKLNIATRQIGRNFLPSFRDFKICKRNSKCTQHISFLVVGDERSLNLREPHACP